MSGVIFMRRFCVPLCILLICAFFCAGFDANAVSFKTETAELSVSPDAVFLISCSRDKLSTMGILPDKVKSDYNLSGTVLAACVYKYDAYALTQSPAQDDVCILTRMHNGKIENELYFRSLKLSQQSRLVVTESYFYVINQKDHVAVFDRKGNKLCTSSFTAGDIVPYENGVLCVCNKSVILLSGCTESTVLHCSVAGKICGIYDDMFCDSSGNVYQLGKGKVFSTGVSGTYKNCVTSDSVLSINGKKIRRYSKSGKLLASVNLNVSYPWIAYYKGKILAISPSGYDVLYTCDSFTTLFPEKKAVSKSKKTSAKLFDGQYIYLSESTTVANFKKSYSDKYTVEFPNKKSGYFGTNTKVSFTSGALCAEYRVVVYSDLTGEGNVNSTDKRALLKHLLGEEKLSGAYLKAADLNGDSRVSNADLVLLTRSITT